MRLKLLAAAGMAAALSVGAAQAGPIALNLTGDTANLTTYSYMYNGSLYETGRLALEGFTTFTINDGDTL